MLATCDRLDPHAALVTPVCNHELQVILLLSDLSRHTAQLRANPHCSLLCVANVPPPAAASNPQTRARLSVLCHAEPDNDPGLRRRYLARRPYATLYADFADFRFWRLEIRRAQLIQGFAQAADLTLAEIAYPVATAEAFRTGEAGVMLHCNAHRASAVTKLGRSLGGADEVWSMIGADPDGCDIMSGGRWVRVAWSTTLNHPSGVGPALANATVQVRC
jgi:putative heme iron utilization protein